MLPTFLIIWLGLSSLGLLRLLVHKRTPYAMIAWGLLIVCVPILGALSFFAFGPQRLEGYATKRWRKISSKGDAPSSKNVGKRDPSDPMHLATGLSRFPETKGNCIRTYSDPEIALKAFVEAIEGARSHIHIEFYIVRIDPATDDMFAALARAVARGVEVRVLYDAHGSLALAGRHLETLKESGVKVAAFLPLTAFFRRLNLNLRNHRKLLLIDGQMGFTGGVNLSSAYLGPRTPKHQFDYTFKIQGPTVPQLETIFVQDWLFAAGEMIEQKTYSPSRLCGDATIQVLESEPVKGPSPLYLSLVALINSARRSIRITNPYFVPNEGLYTSILLAAQRGVDVQMILPEKIDWKIVLLATRSFLDELVEAGVVIHFYRPHLLHAKLIVVDDDLACIGSANLDYRSLGLNFEANLLVRDRGFASILTEAFATDLKQSRTLCPKRFGQRSQWARCVENACRLLAPIL